MRGGTRISYLVCMHRILFLHRFDSTWPQIYIWRNNTPNGNSLKCKRAKRVKSFNKNSMIFWQNKRRCTLTHPTPTKQNTGVAFFFISFLSFFDIYEWFVPSWSRYSLLMLSVSIQFSFCCCCYDIISAMAEFVCACVSLLHFEQNIHSINALHKYIT